MQSPLKVSLVQHVSGLWEASAMVQGQELHFGYFLDQTEAQRTLDLAQVRFGGETADLDAG